MGERRALLIGVQNESFGRLDFVTDVIRDLHQTVLSSQYGSCQPALPNGRELLNEPEATTRSEIMKALVDAIVRADHDQATLFVYFLGHGYMNYEDFYLVAGDTPSPEQADSENAILLGQRIKELLRQYPGVDGLMLVIDACHSGAAIAEPVKGLLPQGLRVEFFAAARPQDVASNGCFSKSLIELLRQGSSHTADAHLHAYHENAHLREFAPDGCRHLAPPTHVALNGGGDGALWLGLNISADLRPALAGTQMAGAVARLTQNWQRRQGPAAQVEQLLSAGTSPIAITGGPGTGKSALLASFGRRIAGENLGLDALVTARLGDNLADLAEALLKQLGRKPSYCAAAERFRKATPVLEQERQPRFDRLVISPLAYLDPDDEPVLVGVDAVDQLDTVQRRRLLDAFRGLRGAALIVTGRRVDDLPAASRVDLPDQAAEAVGRLVRALVDDPDAQKQIIALSEGEWLRARLLCGLHRAGHFADPSPGGGLAPLFQKALSAAVKAAPEAPVKDVARVLAAAPVGAWMPLQVLVAALPPGGGDSQTLVRVRESVVALGELLARADAGSPDERVGPAHDLIARFLEDHLGRRVIDDAHLAIAEALADLPEAGTPEFVAAYARNRLSEHLWAIGRSDEALSKLPELTTPGDNLALWQSWHERLHQKLGPNHPDTLATRSNIARWTGENGDAPGALRLFSELLPVRVRVLGRNHPETLATRGNIARWTGENGDVTAALELLAALLPDLDRVLGPYDRRTLACRGNIAARTEDAIGALELYSELLRDQVRDLGPDHPDTLTTRRNIARRTGENGDGPAALELFSELLRDQKRILGPDHSDSLATLDTRSNIARWTGENGDAPGAVKLLSKLLPDQVQVLGPDHPDTLTTRSDIAWWTGENGDAPGAVKLLSKLLPDQVRVLGPDHPDTLTTRSSIARWTGNDGSAQ